MKFLSTLVMFSMFSIVSLANAAEVDLAKSQFQWIGTKVTGKHEGNLSLKKATLNLEGEKVKDGEFVMNMDSVTVTDLTGEMAQKFLGHVKSPDFLDVQKFPEAILKIKKVDGDKAEGDLTIKGKSHPVSFNILKSGKEFSGVLKFDRTKFDMIYGSGNFFKDLGDKMIHDEVTVNFKVVAK